MKEKKILIVEDEQIIAENLRFILNEYEYSNVDVAIDAAEAREMFKENAYDLVLMDINLGPYSEIDGIDLVKELSKSYSFVYLYVTANADESTVNKAKGTSPLGYIVKPFVNTAIYANVTMALSSLKQQETFTFTDKGMQYQLFVSDILYLESDGSYANIYTVEGTSYFVRVSLADFVSMFAEDFIRIHKSIVINKHCIEAHTSQFVKIGHKKLPIGRTYKQDFIKRIQHIAFK